MKMYQYSLTSLFDQEALEIPPGKEESHRYPFRDFIAISSGSAGGTMWANDWKKKKKAKKPRNWKGDQRNCVGRLSNEHAKNNF